MGKVVMKRKPTKGNIDRWVSEENPDIVVGSLLDALLHVKETCNTARFTIDIKKGTIELETENDRATIAKAAHETLKKHKLYDE